MTTARPWLRTLRAAPLLLIASVSVSACWWDSPPQVSTPQPVTFELPTHLRQCAIKYGVTDPSTFVVRADLELGYAQERAANITKTQCLEEIARLVDAFNLKLRTLK